MGISQTELFAISALNNTISFSKINPVTGYVSPFGNLTGATGLFGGINSAVNCSNGDFAIGAYYNNQYITIVIDNITGNIKGTFGATIRGINYNLSNNNYYGIEGFNFVSINALSGVKSTISTNTLAANLMLEDVGSTLDAVNGRYITTVKQDSTYNIVSISCQNGTYTISPGLPYSNYNLYPNSLAYSNTLNKCYCIMPSPTGGCFGELIISTASISCINSQFNTIIGMATGSDANGGVSIDEQAGIYSIITTDSKVANISIATGSIISNPSLSIQNSFFIQYANSCTLSTGIEEYSLPSPEQTSIYYNIYGEEIQPCVGVLMIEKRGTKTRKVIIIN